MCRTRANYLHCAIFRPHSAIFVPFKALRHSPQDPERLSTIESDGRYVRKAFRYNSKHQKQQTINNYSFADSESPSKLDNRCYHLTSTVVSPLGRTHGRRWQNVLCQSCQQEYILAKGGRRNRRRWFGHPSRSTSSLESTGG